MLNHICKATAAARAVLPSTTNACDYLVFINVNVHLNSAAYTPYFESMPVALNCRNGGGGSEGGRGERERDREREREGEREWGGVEREREREGEREWAGG